MSPRELCLYVSLCLSVPLCLLASLVFLSPPASLSSSVSLPSYPSISLMWVLALASCRREQHPNCSTCLTLFFSCRRRCRPSPVLRKLAANTRYAVLHIAPSSALCQCHLTSILSLSHAVIANSLSHTVYMTSHRDDFHMSALFCFRCCSLAHTHKRYT